MMPTPELAGRFLDADEPRDPVPHAPSPPVVERTARTWFGVWLTRLVVIYLVLYILPFPFTLLTYLGAIPLIQDIPGLMPVLGWPAGLHSQVMNPFVGWVGRTFVGVDAVDGHIGFTVHLDARNRNVTASVIPDVRRPRLRRRR